VYKFSEMIADSLNVCDGKEKTEPLQPGSLQHVSYLSPLQHMYRQFHVLTSFVYLGNVDCCYLSPM